MVVTQSCRFERSQVDKDTKLCLLNVSISLAIIGNALEKLNAPKMHLDDLHVELEELTNRLSEIKEV